MKKNSYQTINHYSRVLLEYRYKVEKLVISQDIRVLKTFNTTIFLCSCLKLFVYSRKWSVRKYIELLNLSTYQIFVEVNFGILMVESTFVHWQKNPCSFFLKIYFLNSIKHFSTNSFTYREILATLSVKAQVFEKLFSIKIHPSMYQSYSSWRPKIITYSAFDGFQQLH